MKKKLSALLPSLALLLCLCACGSTTDSAERNEQAAAGTDDAQTLKVGFICAGDRDDLSYTYNFVRGRNDASVMLAAEGINIEWVDRWNVGEDSTCEDANRELAGAGCTLIFNNAPGFEAFMLNVAPEYPDVAFVSCGGSASRADELPNTHNAYANIHEGRYLAGVVAGLKLQELIDGGAIAPEEAVIGYVGALDCAEVVSAYTAYYLGARSVCPGATMKVRFTGAWSDADAEQSTAAALAAMGCRVISQHSGNLSLASAAQDAGVLHTGYNNDMTALAPRASLVSTRIDWSVYFEHAIRAVLGGGELEQDWCHGLDLRAVELTPLNRDLIADGTDETLDERKAALADGTLQVFDTSTFTVDGAPLEQAYALDTDNVDGIEKLFQST
ncbi:MAG: BMP family ABC transporter substrate-binding protein [Oscillibacter sp.]|nr:BMP family ABC transporter substrate-binding protein [Oscillibacter sp.]